MKKYFFWLLLCITMFTQTLLAQVQLAKPNRYLTDIADYYFQTENISENQLGCLLVQVKLVGNIFSLVPDSVKSLGYVRSQSANIESGDRLNLDYSIGISFTDDLYGLENEPPDFYFFYKKRIILVYTGVSFLKDNRNDGFGKVLKNYRKKIRRSFGFGDFVSVGFIRGQIIPSNVR